MTRKPLRHTPCIFCRERLSSPRGEHVWPTGFIQDIFPDKDHPYRVEIGGRPHLKRDGSPWVQNHFPRVQLPCCKPCNSVLNKRFEQPTKLIVRRLFSDEGAVTLASTEAHLVGLWLLKTCLLLVHPEVRQESTWGSIAPHRWNLTVIPDDLYSWMANDQPPPTNLSAWMSKVRDPEPDDPPSRRMFLPTVMADGRTTQFQVGQFGIRFLDIALVYHPGWPIEHPFEADGRAVRIWPYDKNGAFNSTRLPVISRRAIAWTTGPEVHFAPGMYGKANLPPLTDGMDWMFHSVPGVVRAAALSAGTDMTD